jgi:hypothetical protein
MGSDKIKQLSGLIKEEYPTSCTGLTCYDNGKCKIFFKTEGDVITHLGTIKDKFNAAIDKLNSGSGSVSVPTPSVPVPAPSVPVPAPSVPITLSSSIDLRRNTSKINVFGLDKSITAPYLGSKELPGNFKKIYSDKSCTGLTCFADGKCTIFFQTEADAERNMENQKEIKSKLMEVFSPPSDDVDVTEIDSAYAKLLEGDKTYADVESEDEDVSDDFYNQKHPDEADDEEILYVHPNYILMGKSYATHDQAADALEAYKRKNAGKKKYMKQIMKRK